MSLNEKILHHLEMLEAILKKYQVWEDVSPNSKALASTAPFAVDSLSPIQWLQWIFIPKMRALALSQNLPATLEISPYFEQTLTNHPYQKEIVQQTLSIDALFSNL